MRRTSARDGRRGYQEAVAGSFVGAVVGVFTTRLLTALLVGLSGLVGLELRPVLLSNALMLLLPPLVAVVAYSTALRLAGYRQVGASVLFMLLLSPLGSWLLWEAQQQLGAAELWPLRIIPVVLLTLLAPVAHALGCSFARYAAPSGEDHHIPRLH